MEQLTIKEALEQGYTKYCYGTEGYQGLLDISDVSAEDLSREDIRLVEQTPFSPTGISSKDIAEMLAEHLECNHVDETEDDTEQVYDAIKVLDFTEAENRITEALSKLTYYRGSNIKLIA